MATAVKSRALRKMETMIAKKDNQNAEPLGAKLASLETASTFIIVTGELRPEDSMGRYGPRGEGGS